jgi:hypothetical protein
MKMSNIKRTVLLIGAPAILAVGGLSAMAASAPTATATPFAAGADDGRAVRVSSRSG